VLFVNVVVLVCDCHPTVAWKQWSSHNFKRGLSMCKSGDWFCLSCMDYGLPEALIYYYYYYFKFSYFWPKIWEIFLFQLCIHLTKFFVRKLKKKKQQLLSPEVCETNTFKTWLCTSFQRKQLQCCQTCMTTWAKFIYGVLMWGRLFDFMLI